MIKETVYMISYTLRNTRTGYQSTKDKVVIGNWGRAKQLYEGYCRDLGQKSKEWGGSVSVIETIVQADGEVMNYGTDLLLYIKAQGEVKNNVKETIPYSAQKTVDIIKDNVCTDYLNTKDIKVGVYPIDNLTKADFKQFEGVEVVSVQVDRAVLRLDGQEVEIYKHNGKWTAREYKGEEV